MQCAALPLDEAGLERAVGVDAAQLAPRPNGQRHLVSGRVLLPPTGCICRALLSRGDGHLVGGVAKRRNHLVQDGGGRAHQVGEGFVVVRNPAADIARAFDGIKTTSLAQDAGGQPWVHRIKLFQQAPGRCFTDRQIGVVVCLVLPRSGEGDADDQAHGDQVEQHIKLLRLQRVLFMETGDQRSSGADRVVHVENGVGTGDRNLGYQHGMHGIAKVDEASHGTGSFGIDQNVPVVGIVVDHLGPQGSQPGLYRLFELGDEALDNGPAFRALDEVQARTGARSMAQIPVKVADGTRVHEALQRAIEFAECLAEVAHQCE
ncbi:hypothetical protein D3C76_880830 [compost metagenome]